MRNSRKPRKGSRAILSPKSGESEPFRIPREAHDLKPSELPLSVRLENVLRAMGIDRLGELQGVSVDQFWKERNCGKRTVEELRRLLERVAAGEFQPPRKDFTTADAGEMIKDLEGILDKLPLPRDRKIFLMRLGAETEEAPILKDVGTKFKVTRERVRQIEHKSLTRVRREGGPRLAAQLRAVASFCRDRRATLTPALLSQWLGKNANGRQFPLVFYVRLLNRLEPDIRADT